jgi:hypothetical protein
MIINLWMLIGFIIFIKEETIMFSLSECREEDAMRMIKKVYHKDEDHFEVLESLKKQVTKKTKHVESQWERIWGRQYVRGTLFAMGLTLLY